MKSFLLSGIAWVPMFVLLQVMGYEFWERILITAIVSGAVHLDQLLQERFG